MSTYLPKKKIVIGKMVNKYTAAPEYIFLECHTTISLKCHISLYGKQYVWWCAKVLNLHLRTVNIIAFCIIVNIDNIFVTHVITI
jgi:hypothetical protein